MYCSSIAFLFDLLGNISVSATWHAIVPRKNMGLGPSKRKEAHEKCWHHFY